MGYCTVSELREAGFTTPEWPSSTYGTSYLQALIDRAAAMIDRMTGCRFERHTASIYCDGNDQRLLGPLQPPLIEVSGLSIELGGRTFAGTDVTGSVTLIEKVSGDRRTQYLRSTDTSKIAYRWPVPPKWGDQNIVLTSDAFGWVDTSVSPERAPSPIIQANIDLAARLIILGYNESSAGETSSQGALKSEMQDSHWKKEWYEDKEGGGSIAKSLAEGGDIWMALSPYIFRQGGPITVARVPRG